MGAAIASLVEPVLTRRRRLSWDRAWMVESRRPVAELSTTVPRELIEAVESGWIPASSSIMDIGSGRGQIAAWLAARGFHVLGADLSAEAIKLARRHFQHVSDRLEFRRLDICNDPPDAGRFDALVDRACFHVIPPVLRPRYVDCVAAWAKPDARFLLLCRVNDPMGRVETLRGLFDPHFELIRARPTTERIRRSAGPIPRIEAPGIALWMIRRGAGPRPAPRAPSP
jgi:SAM-dependent methyltransferase